MKLAGMAAIDCSSNGLPVELLMKIIEEHMIISVEEFILLSSVCRSWHHAIYTIDIAKLRNNWTHHHMPWLMLTDGNDAETHASFEVYGARSLLKRFNLRLPEMFGRACWGSPYGWVVTLGYDREMHLFNPITKARVSLPSQETFPYAWRGAKGKTDQSFYIWKAVLLRVPSDNSDGCIWLVVIIHSNGRFVAIAKPGDSAWLQIVLDHLDGRKLYLNDVMYWQNMRSLLFVDEYANLYCCDLSDIERPQKLKLYGRGFSEGFAQGRDQQTTYIVESKGNIFVVLRYTKLKCLPISFRLFKTTNFRVYKLDILTRILVDVQDLQGSALFLGPNSATFSVTDRDAGCRSNCIYFCDDLRLRSRMVMHQVEGVNMGVFSLEDEKIQYLHKGSNSQSNYSSAFWFSPSL